MVPGEAPAKAVLPQGSLPCTAPGQSAEDVEGGYAVVRAPERPRLPPAPPPPKRAVAQVVRFERRPARDYVYWALAIALLPLCISILPGFKDVPLKERLRRTLADAPPALAERIRDQVRQIEILPTEQALEDLLEELPGDRLEGAHLARRTVVHWLYATSSACAFLILILCLFPAGTANPLHILIAGAFTATLGILFLLIVQALAMVTQGVWVRSGGFMAAIFYVLKFIGFSYRSALDPNSNFFLSFLGFTCGVGLCEELCKALPLIFYFRRIETLGWRGACLWGMAAGVGFGVSEGMNYSSHFYNGIASGEVYLIRFTACVALHAVWSAALGISFYVNYDRIWSSQDSSQFALNILRVISAPIVLHGLYDTLLKMELNALALLVALASFSWLARMVEKARADEEAPPAEIDEGTEAPAFLA
jgi:RsiW-degrading membrane proteinase PrsW (M82 family)